MSSDLPTSIYPPEGMIPRMQSESAPYQFVRSVSTLMHKTKSTKTDVYNLPAFIHYHPFPSDIDVPKIDCSRGTVPRCSTCKSYLSPFISIGANQQSWRCPLCHHLNSTIHFTGLYDFSKETVERPETHHLVYDIIPSKNLYMQKAQPRSYCFIVDENLLNRNSGNSEQTINLISGLLDCFADQDTIRLITLGGSITLYEINNKHATSFVEYDPDIILNKEPYTVNAQESFLNLIDCIKSRSNSKTSSTPLYLALEWAAGIMEGSGGRVIIFSSGTCTEDPRDKEVLPMLIKNRISVSIFSTTPLPVLHNIVQKTCGEEHTLDNFEALRSLFTRESFWDTVTTIRTDKECVLVDDILGGGSDITNGGEPEEPVSERSTIYPITDSSSSFTYSLAVTNPEAQQIIVQFATRYTTDSGERLIRVVNAAFPLADFPPMPFDEAALALYFLRSRPSESFGSRVSGCRKYAQLDMIHILLARGARFDTSGWSVERFALSVLPTKVSLDSREFSVIFGADRTFVSPLPNEIELGEIRKAAEQLRIPFAPVIASESAEEIEKMIGTLEEANNWFYGIQ